MTQLHAIKPPTVYHLHRTPPAPPPPLPSPRPSNTTTAAAPVIIIFDGQLISWPGALTSVGSTHQVIDNEASRLISTFNKLNFQSQDYKEYGNIKELAMTLLKNCSWMEADRCSSTNWRYRLPSHTLVSSFFNQIHHQSPSIPTDTTLRERDCDSAYKISSSCDFLSLSMIYSSGIRIHRMLVSVEPELRSSTLLSISALMYKCPYSIQNVIQHNMFLFLVKTDRANTTQRAERDVAIARWNKAEL
ncbi:hypothetical protein QVD17_15775 [Tagetes erecta]|uniref:Uncharacterized protein n=1 Tax=Tagetes erecta TaxID=13708 RepID=A0AAD8KVI8_TARER|nr:hypothetical protein QVD17_15775 [Tagetes erecta]